MVDPARPRPRRWPWVVAIAVLALVLLAATGALVVRNGGEPAALATGDDAAAELDQRLDDLLAAPAEEPGSTVPAPTVPEPTVPRPTAPDGGGSNPLQDLLGGVDGVDAACLQGEDPSTPKLQGGIDGDVAEQVTEIARLVEAERGLQFDKPVQPEVLEAAAFDQRIADMVTAEYPAEQADLDGRVLGLLGAIPKETDLKALQQDLLSGQVAGYYDPETGEIVVRVPEGEDSLDAASQITLAHELDHALTDQALDLPDTEEAAAGDANLARLALIEGDATLLMQRFSLRHIGLLDQLQGALGPDAMAAQNDLEDVPPYLRNELMFPYTAGLAYACRLQEGSGWPGVDAAYRSLPASTAEVLFADRAGFDPDDPRDVGRPGGSWEQAREDTIGAASLLWLFEAPGGAEDEAIRGAEAAAQAWAGGELALFTDGPRSALGLSLVDDSGQDRLCPAVEAWYTAAFDASRSERGGAVTLTGDDQVAVLHCEGESVRLGIAPDEATASALTR